MLAYTFRWPRSKRRRFDVGLKIPSCGIITYEAFKLILRSRTFCVSIIYSRPAENLNWKCEVLILKIP